MHSTAIRLITARANECANLAHAYHLAAMDSQYRYNEYAQMGVGPSATVHLEAAKLYQQTGAKYAKLAMDYRISVINGTAHI